MLFSDEGTSGWVYNIHVIIHVLLIYPAEKKQTKRQENHSKFYK